MSWFQRKPERPSRINISGRINDGLYDIKKLAMLYAVADRWAANGYTLGLDFSECEFLRPTAVAALGGIIAHIESKGGEARILQNTLQPSVRTALTKNGFLAAHTTDSGSSAANSTSPLGVNNAVAYHHDHSANADSFAQFLADEWLGRNWVTLGPEVRQEITQSLVELHNNAFEHGRAPGFFTCGQKFPARGEVQVSFLDFGDSIPGTVKSLARNSSFKDHEAIIWALKPGNTSKLGFSRGLGFDVLMDLVSGEESHLEIYSGFGTVRSARREPIARPMDFRFPGTLVQVTISTAGVGKMLAERPRPVIQF